MTRALAITLWALLAVFAGTGCFYFQTSAVEQTSTTADRLRAIDTLRAARPDGPATEVGPPSPWKMTPPTSQELDAIRTKLLSAPPSLSAGIERDGTSRPIAEYSEWSPGLYESVAAEVHQLQRAHEAGVLTDQELAELTALAKDQGRRSIVRRASGGVWNPERFVSGSVHGGIFGSYGTRLDAESRERAARRWVEEQARLLRAPPQERSRRPTRPAQDPESGEVAESYRRIWLVPRLPRAPEASPAPDAAK